MLRLSMQLITPQVSNRFGEIGVMIHLQLYTFCISELYLLKQADRGQSMKSMPGNPDEKKTLAA